MPNQFTGASGGVYANGDNFLEALMRTHSNDPAAIARGLQGVLNPFAAQNSYGASGKMPDASKLSSGHNMGFAGANGAPLDSAQPISSGPTDLTGGDKTVSNPYSAADFWYNQPTDAMSAWLANNGMGGNTNDPFVQWMQQLAGGMPFLWNAQGNSWDQPGQNFGDMMQGMLGQLTSGQSGFAGLGASPMYNYDEMRSMLGGLLSGDPAQILAGSGSGNTGENANTSVEGLINALKTSTDSQALNMFLSMMGSMGATSLDPLTRGVMQKQTQDAFNLWNAQQGIAGAPPMADPSNTANNTNRFWQWLTTQPSIMQQYFGLGG